MKKDDCFYFGKIGKAKGYKGELNLIIDKDSPILPENLNTAYLLIGKKLVEYSMEDYLLTPKGNAIVNFTGFSSDEDAERIKNLSVYLPKSLLPELDEDEVYQHDLLDCVIIDEKIGEIGPITEINTQTAQTLLFVDYNGTEIMIPYVDAFILQINKKEKQVHVELPEGIVDLND